MSPKVPYIPTRETGTQGHYRADRAGEDGFKVVDTSHLVEEMPKPGTDKFNALSESLKTAILEVLKNRGPKEGNTNA